MSDRCCDLLYGDERLAWPMLALAGTSQITLRQEFLNHNQTASLALDLLAGSGGFCVLFMILCWRITKNNNPANKSVGKYIDYIRHVYVNISLLPP